MCEFGSQVSRQSPTKGLPHLALWHPCRSHHRNHARQEWIIIVIRQELSPVTCKLEEKQINLRRYTPDRHCENGSILWRDEKNHQNDVTTSYATASRCVTTVPFSWWDGQNHQMMWPPAMQQHPGASLYFVARRIESPHAGTRYCVQYLIHQMSTASLARLGQMAPCPMHWYYT